MIRALVLAIFALGLAAAGPPPITGPARVVDGDTLVIGRQRVRIWGIDAPEGLQTCQDGAGRRYRCGDIAHDRLRAMIGTAEVSCMVKDHDPYERAVSQCQGGGLDLGEAMVRAGWAVDYVQFSGGAYSAAQTEARRARRGLWAGTFEMPAAWRAEARQASRLSQPSPPPAECQIKGNINAKGRRIFHMPGQQDYAATAIDTARGERWFCSALEARSAGWMPAAR